MADGARTDTLPTHRVRTEKMKEVVCMTIFGRAVKLLLYDHCEPS